MSRYVYRYLFDETCYHLTVTYAPYLTLYLIIIFIDKHRQIKTFLGEQSFSLTNQSSGSIDYLLSIM